MWGTSEEVERTRPLCPPPNRTHEWHHWPQHGDAFFTFACWWEAEMSGLWNFSVRVQSWSNTIESDPVLIRKIFENHQSDPVLIRQCKIMCIYFASWSKTTTGAILPLAKYDCLKVLTCLSLCNTQARAVNLIHTVLCDVEGVTQARGC